MRNHCPKCDAQLIGKFCKCGYKPPRPPMPDRQELVERESEVKRFADQYRKDHPGTSYREVCDAYYKSHKPPIRQVFATALPKAKWNDEK